MRPCPAPSHSSLLISATTLLRLPSLGLLMDKMESGEQPLSARQYRKAAQAACDLISENPRHLDVRTVCLKSPALAQILQNVLMAEAVRAGKMRWLHSMKF